MHRLYAGGELPRTLAERFGAGVLRPDGSVDRAALGAIVFADPAARRALEALTHPLVGDAFAEWTARSSAARLLVHEVPLLFEAGLEDRYDRILAVTASPEVRRRRLEAGRRSVADLDGREAAQLSPGEKERRADDVIVNDGSVDELRAAVAVYVASLGV